MLSFSEASVINIKVSNNDFTVLKILVAIS
jgi:hypothetical protein